MDVIRLQEKRSIFASPPCCFLRCPVLPELLGRNFAEPVSRKCELEAADAYVRMVAGQKLTETGGRWNPILLFRGDFGSSEDCMMK